METKNEPVEIIIPEYYTYYGGLINCPKCEGDNIYGLPRQYIQAKYICADCGEKWEAPEIQKKPYEKAERRVDRLSGNLRDLRID